jgi:hypothetical protein
MIHEIKCWPEYFQPLWIGTKEFEVRRNDRDYRVGESLRIMEFNPNTQTFTGREFVRRIAYMIQGVCGLPEDICVMQLR